MIDKVRDGKERRVLKRRHLLFYLEISNKPTGEILGHLGDITVDGLMIISPRLIPIGQRLDVMVSLPNLKEFDQSRFEAQVETLWSHPDFNTVINCYGSRLVYIHTDIPSLIQHLIRV
ncbi:MAG: hypothetical protein KBA26_12925, partial [Candidatus Delongbacteria bacterium]|nr:hypothetical protein [Candidatus Delongbacteria bacterium]